MESTKNAHEFVQKKIKNALLQDFSKFSKNENELASYTQHLDQMIKSCNEEIEKFHYSVNFYEKLEKMRILSAENEKNQCSKRSWRFFDDMDKSINSLVFENKNDFVRVLKDMDEQYNGIIQTLEDDLVQKKNQLGDLINKMI